MQKIVSVRDPRLDFAVSAFYLKICIFNTLSLNYAKAVVLV